MLSKKDYCDYETLIALKELGFPLKTLKVDGEIKNVPTFLYEVSKWLREEYNLHILPTMVCSKDVRYKIIIWGKKGDDYFRGLYNTFYDEDLKNDKPTSYNSYEEALLEGIKRAIKLLKECNF